MDIMTWHPHPCSLSFPNTCSVTSSAKPFIFLTCTYYSTLMKFTCSSVLCINQKNMISWCLRMNVKKKLRCKNCERRATWKRMPYRVCVILTASIRLINERLVQWNDTIFFKKLEMPHSRWVCLGTDASGLPLDENNELTSWLWFFLLSFYAAEWASGHHTRRMMTAFQTPLRSLWLWSRWKVRSRMTERTMTPYFVWSSADDVCRRSSFLDDVRGVVDVTVAVDSTTWWKGVWSFSLHYEKSDCWAGERL